MLPIEIATSTPSMSPRPPVIYYVRYYSQRYGTKILGIMVLLSLLYFALWFMEGGTSICGIVGNLSAQVDDDLPAITTKSTSPQVRKRHRYSDHINPNTLDATELLSPAARRRHFYHPPCLQSWLEASHPSYFTAQNQSRDTIASYIRMKYQILDFDVIKPMEKKGFLDDNMNMEQDNNNNNNEDPDSVNSNNNNNNQKKKNLHYIPMECDTNQFQTNAITFSAPMLQDNYHHFLSFVASYYRHYSLLLWQSNIYHTIQESCIHGFAVDESAHSFWQAAVDIQSPIRHIIQHINRYSGYNTITTNVCNSVIAGSGYQKTIYSVMLDETEQFFLHPSDALLMSTSIARLSPCTWAKQGLSLAATGANVTVIQAPATAADGSPVPLHSLLHVGNVVGFSDYLRHHFQKQTPFLIQQVSSASLTASMSLKQIATTYLSTDIVLTLNVDMANFLSFMKPCSALVLVRIPHLVDEHGKLLEVELHPEKSLVAAKEQAVIDTKDEVLRSTLAARSDIIYRRVDLSLVHAVLDQDFLSHHSNCQSFFANTEEAGGSKEVRMPHGCVHAIMGWDLQKDFIKAVLHDVIKERSTCLKSHVYYA